MNLKFIFKVLSFSLATSFVFAAEKNNCNEIENYLKKKSLDYKENIEKCVTNSQGKVEELIVRNYALQKEDVKQILSYNSIKNLTYAVEFKFGEEQDSLYSNPFLPHPGYIKFPSVIADLPELEHLNFEYDHFRRIKYTPEVEVIKIENEYLKLSKKLKTLTLSEVKLTKENLVELSKLSNLEELNFYHCVFDSDDFTPFENNKNLSKLLIHDAMGNEKYFPNHIEKLKSLKQLYLENSHCKGTSYNFNGLDNLELFYFKISSACDIDLSKLNKLSELSIVSSDYVFFNGIDDPMDLKLPDSLKILNLSHLTLTSNNYKEIFSLSHLEELIIYCFGNSDKIDIKSLKNPDKLRKLVINSYDRKSSSFIKNLDFLKELENLTKLELVKDGITEIPQLKYLKKLEYLNLKENNLLKIPEAIPTLKNIEYINLDSNIIYGRLPESLNKLEKLKYFNINKNKNIIGKVLTNKNIEECYYSSYYDLCVPKDSKVNYSTSQIENEKTPFKTCEDEKVIEESTNGKCGEGHGKCPSGQCCNKEGKCGNEEDYCLVTKGCQVNYGDYIDECEVIYRQMIKLGEDITYVVCSANKQGKAKDLSIENGNNNYVKALDTIYNLELLTLSCEDSIKSFKPIIQNQNLTRLSLSGDCYKTEDIPDDILQLKNLKTFELHYKSMKIVSKKIKYLKNLENINFESCEIEDLPNEFGELENLKSLILYDNELTKLPEVIAKLKNLEYLDLSSNNIDDKIPESYNNLSELKKIYLGNNVNLEGKILQNKKLVECKYNHDIEWDSSYKYHLCRTGNEKCLSEYLIKAYPICPDSSITIPEKPTTKKSTVTTTTTTTTSKKSTTSSTSKKSTTTSTSKKSTTSSTSKKSTTTSTSKKSTTSSTSKKRTITSTSKKSTTPSTFKKSTTTSTSKKSTTTSTSKKRTITSTSKKSAISSTSKKSTTTSTSKKSTTTSTSKKSTTSSTSKETTTTTASKSSVKGKCGEGIGNCKSGYCCSKYGWCGISDGYCSKSNGCQSKYGKCY
jgi:Leucine-rich repeat (LRR) protein